MNNIIRGRWLSKIILGVFFGIIGLYSQAAADVHLQHEPLQCALPESPIPVTFHVVSANPPQETRIYFRVKEAEAFYFIQGTLSEENMYQGILPGVAADVSEIEYLLLVVEDDETIVKSPIFSVPVGEQAACPDFKAADLLPEMTVFSEQELEPEQGFLGENITWNVSGDVLGTPYAGLAQEQAVEPFPAAAIEDPELQEKGGLHFGKKSILGIGAGAGTLAALGAVALNSESGGGDGDSWESLDDEAEDVTAELVKSPDIQTACGTFVTNQLFIINSGETDVTVGTIDYEVVLTRDRPSGSCEAGKTGSFAPNLATLIPAGQTLLIRQWTNEVNPCSACPYLTAECVWESRYIIHTSAGSVPAIATFTAEGDLCETSTASSMMTKDWPGMLLQGDVEP